MQTLIIDDEPKARRILETLLSEYCPQLQLWPSSSTLEEALPILMKESIDIVFLDIEMPNHSGLELFDFIKKPEFAIIFTTAYQEYALQAFEVEAVDYLLKPIQIQRLLQAVQKAQARQAKSSASPASREQKSLPSGRLALPTSEGLAFFDYAEIVYLKAEGAYTKVVLRDKAPFLVSKNIKQLESLLPAELFLRTHRSYMIHLQYVEKYCRADSEIQMRNGDRVSLSREKKDIFLKAFSIDENPG
ncbi:MAG: response regulator transcription factor [Microscillaceae bacterium]|nr:response regulator transcription factor [Microscillaceae bacterium]